jgi:hypothetical protein
MCEVCGVCAMCGVATHLLPVVVSKLQPPPHSAQLCIVSHSSTLQQADL